MQTHGAEAEVERVLQHYYQYAYITQRTVLRLIRNTQGSVRVRAWHGMVWYGIAWYGMVWDGMG